jgi:hypothetical protein
MIFTAKDRAEIVRRYLRGDKVRDIAYHFGCDYTFPTKLATRQGLAKRRPYKTRPTRVAPHRHHAASAHMSLPC